MLESANEIFWIAAGTPLKSQNCLSNSIVIIDFAHRFLAR
ncbi:hypothetical protein CEV32_0211 [Brucella rhizosphaerae]|uniref:Uncharacterized protein n=1 Tax=Brucella rhizosphaerae TaxID=571254 RepID=A0A256FHA8_9HYPH|nr:hypothetical protein CEV32_0211 [Brucella rhizosphaerae]